MRDKFIENWEEDFSRRYSGTYGWIVHDGVKTPVRITRVNSDGLSYTTHKGFQGQLPSSAKVEFEFTQVPKGWFKTRRGPRYFFRKPARQWQRGICEANTGVISNPGRGDEGIDFDYFMDLFTQETLPKDPAILSRYFAVQGGRLYAFSTPIGAAAKKKIVLSNSLFRQELVDTIKRNNLEWELE